MDFEVMNDHPKKPEGGFKFFIRGLRVAFPLPIDISVAIMLNALN